MDRQQIDTLHEQASERYLEGDYRGALQMWDRLLAANPSDQRAQEGVRLCRLLADTSRQDVPPESAAEAAGGGDEDLEPQVEVVRDELDIALSAFDGLRPKMPATPAKTPAAGVPDADTSPGARAREAVTSPGIDEAPSDGDPGAGPGSDELPLDFDLEATLLDGEAQAGDDPDSPRDAGSEVLEDLLADLPGSGAADPGASAELEPVESNPAAEELRRRVRDLMEDARTAAAEGRQEQALTVLGRLFILDENHAEARALERSIREELSLSTEEIDRRIAEGVQALQSGNRDGARDLFLSVLDHVPEHAEARSYLERLDAAEDGAGEAGELRLGEMAPDTFDSVAEHGNVDLGEETVDGEASDLALAGARGPGADSAGDPDAFGSLIGLGEASAEEEVDEPGPSVIDAVEKPAIRSSSRGKLLALLAVVVLVGGGFAAWKAGMLNAVLGNDAPVEHPPAGVTQEAPAAPRPEDQRSTQELLAEADRLTGTTPEPATGTDAERFQEMMRRGQAAIDDGDYAAAVLAFNEAIEILPDDAEAARAFLEAGRLYRGRQMQLEELHRAEQSFQAGDYVSALRSLYRLPQDLRPRDVHRYKVNAWYNLGVVALRAGDTREAMGHFDEVLGIEPDDAEAEAARAFAEQWDGQMKDRIYYGDVENLEFRGLDS